MATKYWKGGAINQTTIWNNSNNWSLTENGQGGAGIPTYADDVIIADNTYDCTLNTNEGYCKSLTVNTSFDKNLKLLKTLNSKTTIEINGGVDDFSGGFIIEEDGDFIIGTSATNDYPVGKLTIGGDSTITNQSFSFNEIILYGYSKTITFVDNITCNRMKIIPGTNVIFSENITVTINNYEGF